MKTKLWDHAKAVLDGCNACQEHHSGLSLEDIEDVVAAFEGCSCEWSGNKACDTYCDHEGAAVVTLKQPNPKGKAAFLWECEDTSGHG